MNRLVEIRELSKKFPIKGSKDVIHAVSSVNLYINKAETLGLIGESGSGKTTVGRCLLRLIEPTSGEIFIDGVDIINLEQRTLRQQRCKMQMVFQDPYASLDPRMDIESSISEPLVFSGYDPKKRRDRVREVIKEVGLNDSVLSLFPHQLSAGDQQRIGIARALTTKPSLIILDEPVSSLDLTIRAQILELLAKIQEEAGVSYLYISHDLTTVKYLCHRVAVMYLSTLVETGSTENVFGNPIHPYSRALLSSALPIDPRIKRPRYQLAGEIPSPINLPSGCVLHNRCPEAIPDCSKIVPGLESINLMIERPSNCDDSLGTQEPTLTGNSAKINKTIDHKVACIRAKEMIQKHH